MFTSLLGIIAISGGLVAASPTIIAPDYSWLPNPALTKTPAGMCQVYNRLWVTQYAPDSGDDVRYYDVIPVSSGMNPETCSPGIITEPPFLSDALDRLTFARWLAGLGTVQMNSSNQMASQSCALMMAMNYNPESPWAHNSSDPHTDQTGWDCTGGGASAGATYGNIYAGDSIVNPGFDWQTTPAFILDGFILDFSSTKSGHRQNILCPNLDQVGIGHVCYYEPQTQRYYCGGCHWIYGRNANPMPSSGFVAWPPPGPVPDDFIIDFYLFLWTFAYLDNSNGVITPVVTINGAVVASTTVYSLCTGSGLNGIGPAIGPGALRWLSFQPDSDLPMGPGADITVVVKAGTQSWSYTVQVTNCSLYPSLPTLAPSPPPPTPNPVPPPTLRPTLRPTVPPPTIAPPTVAPPTFAPPSARPTAFPLPPTISPPTNAPPFSTVPASTTVFTGPATTSPSSGIASTTTMGSTTMATTTALTTLPSTTTTEAPQSKTITTLLIVLVVICVLLLLAGIIVMVIYRHRSLPPALPSPPAPRGPEMDSDEEFFQAMKGMMSSQPNKLEKRLLQTENWRQMRRIMARSRRHRQEVSGGKSPRKTQNKEIPAATLVPVPVVSVVPAPVATQTRRRHQKTAEMGSSSSTDSESLRRRQVQDRHLWRERMLTLRERQERLDREERRISRLEQRLNRLSPALEARLGMISPQQLVAKRKKMALAAPNKNNGAGGNGGAESISTIKVTYFNGKKADNPHRHKHRRGEEEKPPKAAITPNIYADPSLPGTPQPRVMPFG